MEWFNGILTKKEKVEMLQKEWGGILKWNGGDSNYTVESTRVVSKM